MSTLTNGRVRKSLSDQLDRLDHTLDGLADGLQEAIADAVQAAVKRVLAEVLANADFQARLQATRCDTEKATTPTASPSRVRVFGQRLWQWIGRCWQMGTSAVQSSVSGVFQATRNGIRSVTAGLGRCWNCVCRTCRSGWENLKTSVSSVGGQLVDCLLTVWRTLKVARHVALPLLVSLAAGGMVGVAAYHASPWLAAISSGFGGFVTMFSVHVGFWLRRLLVKIADEVV